MMQEFYASAIRQTEGALCDELREYGFKSVRLNRGGIPFRGEWSEGWRACLQSRIAQRILVLMGRSPVTTADQLYDATRAIDWTRISPASRRCRSVVWLLAAHSPTAVSSH